jgi:hypothetical protein
VRKSIDRIGVDATVLVELDTELVEAVEMTAAVEAETTVLAEGLGDAQPLRNMAATPTIRNPRIAAQ